MWAIRPGLENRTFCKRPVSKFETLWPLARAEAGWWEALGPPRREEKQRLKTHRQLSPRLMVCKTESRSSVLLLCESGVSSATPTPTPVSLPPSSARRPQSLPEPEWSLTWSQNEWDKCVALAEAAMRRGRPSLGLTLPLGGAPGAWGERVVTTVCLLSPDTAKGFPVSSRDR